MYSIEKLLKDYNYLLMIAIIGVLVFVTRGMLNTMNLEQMGKTLKNNLMSLPDPIKLVLLAIPEQMILYNTESKMDMAQRLSVSLANYVINYAYNGKVAPDDKSACLPRIIGSALYARNVLRAKQSTMILLIAANSVITLALRRL